MTSLLQKRIPVSLPNRKKGFQNAYIIPKSERIRKFRANFAVKNKVKTFFQKNMRFLALIQNLW